MAASRCYGVGKDDKIRILIAKAKKGMAEGKLYYTTCTRHWNVGEGGLFRSGRSAMLHQL